MNIPSTTLPLSSTPRFLRGVSLRAITGAILLAAAAHAAPSTTLVISQVYGGGGNTGATYKNDFVELHNISNSTVSITDWSVQYASSTGTSWAVTTLTGSIPAGGYYLVRLGPVGTVGADLPTPDLVGSTSTNLSGTAGKVALSNTASALSGSNPVGGPTVVDFVGYGTANAFEGTAAAPAPSNANSASRKDFGSQDTDQNSTDFQTGTASARNSSSPPYIPVSDTQAPVVQLLSPAEDATQAFVDADLAIVFDETIQTVAGGTIVIKTSIGDPVESITLPSARVTISGSIVRVNPDTTLTPGASYYVEVSAGAFTDISNNPAPAISGDAAWNFTTRSAGSSVLISQYYEGLDQDRYIELRNLTGSPLSLAGYRLVVWSDTAPSDNEGWKSGAATSSRVTDLSAYSIPANGTFLIAEQDAVVPAYAATNNDLKVDGGSMAFDGDDSIVLYSGTGFTTDRIVDVVSISTSQGTDTSYYRLNNNTGFDFTVGSSIANYGTVWTSKLLADVASALITDEWYLQASDPPKTLTLAITPSAFSEAAGNGAATATVTRSGLTTEPLLVTIDIQGTKATTDDLILDIPAGDSSADFPINAVNDLWLLGDATVTFTVSAGGFVPDSKQVTVFDQESDSTFPVVINEIRIDDDNSDGFEYFELYNKGDVAVSLNNLSYVVIGDNSANSSGIVESVTAIPTGVTLNPGELYLVAKQASMPIDVDTDGDQTADFTAAPDLLDSSINFENSDNVTHLLLYDFIGTNGSDLDTNDDGVLDATPWLSLIDGVGLVESVTNPPTGTEWAYGATLGFVDIGPDVSFVPNHVYRTTDGGTWAIGPLGSDQDILPGGDNSVLADVKDTPGATNVGTPPSNTFAAWIASFDFSAYPGADLTLAGDADGDGLANSVENILGSSPAAPSQGLTAVSSTGGNLVFRHTFNGSPASDLAAAYEWSVNLVDWNADGSPSGGTTVTFGAPTVITPGIPDLIQVTATVTGTPAKVFARLKVEQVVP